MGVRPEVFGKAKTRALDAANGGRRSESAKTVDGLSVAILAGATTAAGRAGWYACNNPWVAAAVDSLAGDVIDASVKPQSARPDCTGREVL